MNNTHHKSFLAPSIQEKISRYSSDLIQRGLILANRIGPSNFESILMSDEYISLKRESDNDVVNDLEASINGLYSLGISKFLLGDEKSALEYFNQVLSLDRYNTSSIAIRSVIYSNLENHEQYEQDLKRLLEILEGCLDFNQPIHVLYVKFIAMSSIRGDTDASSQLYKSAITSEPIPGSISESLDFFFRGSLHYLSDSYYLAVDDFGKALKKDNYNVKALIMRGMIYSSKNQDRKGSVQDLSKALQINPSHLKSDLTYYVRGCSYFYLKDIDKALEDFSKALRVNPRHAISYAFRAVTYLMKGDFVKTESDINSAIQIDSNAYNIVQPFVEGLEKYLSHEESQAGLKKFLLLLGDASSDLDDYLSALRSYKYAFSIQPSDYMVSQKIEITKVQLANYIEFHDNNQQYFSPEKSRSSMCGIDYIHMISYIFTLSEKLSSNEPIFTEMCDEMRDNCKILFANFLDTSFS